MADVVLMENVDGVHTFSAYVLVDFEASVVGVELSVKKGEWVAVTVDDDDEPPKGWCMCCVTRPAEGESYGLVPWSYLVSAAHAELKAAAEGLERSGEGGAADRTEELGLRLARGQDGAFGLDIDDLNCVRRTSPGGAAESSQIRVGDVVIAVDGELLAGRSIVEVMRPGAPEYEVTVLRGIFSHDEVGSPDAAARIKVRPPPPPPASPHPALDPSPRNPARPHTPRSVAPSPSSGPPALAPPFFSPPLLRSDASPRLVRR